ncbi:MAG: nuclear transport factor 2 family protein, partial [Actinomycetota bacterium]
VVEDAPTADAESLSAMLVSLYNDDDSTTLRELVHPDVEHYSPAIGDGVDAWADFAARFAGEQPVVEIHRAITDGDTVLVHAEYAWNPARELDGGLGSAVAHVFTIENGLVVRAVEVTQAVSETSVSGHGMFEQVGESATNSDTDANRAATIRMVTEALAGDASAVDELVGDYIQHNPLVPDGRDGVVGLVDATGGFPSQFGTAAAERDLGATLVLYDANPVLGGVPVVGVDIFRFGEDGLITEHWDVLEPEFISPDGRTFPFG